MAKNYEKHLFQKHQNYLKSYVVVGLQGKKQKQKQKTSWTVIYLSSFLVAKKMAEKKKSRETSDTLSTWPYTRGNISF